MPSIPPQHADSAVNAAFVSDLDDFIKESGVPLWIYGHIFKRLKEIYFNSTASCSPSTAASAIGRFPSLRLAGPSRNDTARISIRLPLISA